MDCRCLGRLQKRAVRCSELAIRASHKRGPQPCPKLISFYDFQAPRTKPLVPACLGHDNLSLSILVNWSRSPVSKAAIERFDFFFLWRGRKCSRLGPYNCVSSEKYSEKGPKRPINGNSVDITKAKTTNQSNDPQIPQPDLRFAAKNQQTTRDRGRAQQKHSPTVATQILLIFNSIKSKTCIITLRQYQPSCVENDCFEAQYCIVRTTPALCHCSHWVKAREAW